MTDKANFQIGSAEFTAYFHISDGESAPCRYCGQSGPKQMVSVESIETVGGPLDPEGADYTKAEAKIQRNLYHGRAVCMIGTDCEEKYIDERSERAAAVGIVLT